MLWNKGLKISDSRGRLVLGLRSYEQWGSVGLGVERVGVEEPSDPLFQACRSCDLCKV